MWKPMGGYRMSKRALRLLILLFALTLLSHVAFGASDDRRAGRNNDDNNDSDNNMLHTPDYMINGPVYTIPDSCFANNVEGFQCNSSGE